MARVTVEDCLPKVENRFSLVLLATRRTRQLMAGSRPAVENRDQNKFPVLALREIAADKIHFDRNVRDALEGKFDDKPMGHVSYREISANSAKTAANVPASRHAPRDGE